MKRISKTLFIALLAIMLVGCGAKSEGSKDKSTAENPYVNVEDLTSYDFAKEGLPSYNEKIAELEDRTLDVWLASDFANEPPIVDAIQEFENVYPNIKVKVVGYPWEDIQDQILKSVNGGNPPDMVHQDAYRAGSEGVAEPVEDLWTEWGAADEFLNGALNIATWEGEKYGVPLELNTTFYLYDQELFEQEGVKVPETMDDLVSASKALTTDSRYGFISVSSGWDLYGFIVAAGGDLVEEQADGSLYPSLNNDIVLDVVKKYTDIVKVDKSSPVPPPQKRQADNPIAMFGADRAAAFTSGPWDLKSLENDFPEKYKNLGTAVIPGNGEGSVAGGGSLFVPKGSDDREASFELMKWIVSEKYALRMAEEMGRTPVRSSIYDTETFDDPILAPFIETLDKAKVYPLINPEVADIFDSAIRDIFDGDDPEKRLNDAQKKAEKAVERSEG